MGGLSLVFALFRRLLEQYPRVQKRCCPRMTMQRTRNKTASGVEIFRPTRMCPMMHPGVNWQKLRKRLYRTPWSPKIKGPLDDSNIDDYDEDDKVVKFRGDQREFADF